MADPHLDQTYYQIKSNFGYCLQLQRANELVKKHEENTDTRYALLRSDPNFGYSTWHKEDCRIQWEESEKNLGERLTFDGVPFFMLGTRHLGCQFGEENAKKMNIYMDWKKDSNVKNCEAKKENCPGKIILKEVIKFPDYKIDSNTNYERKKWSKIIRDDLCRGTARTERRIYIELPKSEAHVHAIVWKKSNEDQSMPTHCLVCNAKLSSSTRSTVALFSDAARTSHRQLEVCSVLSDMINQELVESEMHSTTICSKCFNLIDDVDSLEEQLANKKQTVVDKYVRTMGEVNGNADSSDNAPIDWDDSEDYPYGAKRRVRSRGRGKPPGRPRGRGSGRPRGRPRTNALLKSQEKGIVKLEDDRVKFEDMNVTYFTTMTSPPSLKTIKKEDIMSDMDSPINHPSRISEDEDGNNGIVAVVEAADNMVERVAVELQGDVLEVVGEVLEEEKKHEVRKFSCSECDKQFLTKAAVRNHVKVHSHMDSYDCDECEKSFLTRHRLRAHMKTHGNRDRPYICKQCDKSFYTSYHLGTHMKSHIGYKNFVCDICGKPLSSQKTLELHALTHSGEKPYQCEICGSTFRQRSNLHTHIKTTHYQEKNHHCQICQKSFVRKRLLVYHMNSMHTGERPYKCDLCSATFVYPHYYKRHLRKHTGDKPHKCHVCGKMFTSRENRNAHLFIHSTKRPYECKICGAGFMRKPLCISHVSGHGSTENPEVYIVFNSPSLMVNAAAQGQVSQETMILPDEVETDRAVQAVRMVEGTHESPDDTTQIYAMRDDKVVKVMSRPVHIIEADDNTRYVFHTTDRGRDENVEHFFAALQGQVVEVQTEDF